MFVPFWFTGTHSLLETSVHSDLWQDEHRGQDEGNVTRSKCRRRSSDTQYAALLHISFPQTSCLLPPPSVLMNIGELMLVGRRQGQREKERREGRRGGRAELTSSEAWQCACSVRAGCRLIGKQRAVGGQIRLAVG